MVATTCLGICVVENGKASKTKQKSFEHLNLIRTRSRNKVKLVVHFLHDLSSNISRVTNTLVFEPVRAICFFLPAEGRNQEEIRVSHPSYQVSLVRMASKLESETATLIAFLLCIDVMNQTTTMKNLNSKNEFSTGPRGPNTVLYLLMTDEPGS